MSPNTTQPMKLRNILHSDIITKILKTIKTIKAKHEKWVSSADIGRELGMQSTHKGTPDTGLAPMALQAGLKSFPTIRLSLNTEFVILLDLVLVQNV
jgi:hypothetical protein